MGGLGALAARSLPTAIRRGMCRAAQLAERPGIPSNSPGMRDSTPGMCRVCEPAERRGMHQGCPGMCGALEPTDQACATTPQVVAAVCADRPTRHAA